MTSDATKSVLYLVKPNEKRRPVLSYQKVNSVVISGYFGMTFKSIDRNLVALEAGNEEEKAEIPLEDVERMTGRQIYKKMAYVTEAGKGGKHRGQLGTY